MKIPKATRLRRLFDRVTLSLQNQLPNAGTFEWQEPAKPRRAGVRRRAR